ncbi:MAG: hypothetical protein J5J06_04180 [Phycisphaerae bacterium]|nr:hypothetical protein [Phycisphaerae bacterium]
MNKSFRMWGLAGGAVALLSASAMAQTPVFSLEIAAINGQVLRNISCTSNAQCPGNSTCVGSKCTNATTLSEADGDISPGDMIKVDAFVRNWDSTVTTGICENGDACSTVTPGSCTAKHCSGNVTVACPDSEFCAARGLGICVDDTCDPHPLLGSFQWRMDPATYVAGGGTSPTGKFNVAEIACVPADCNYTNPQVPVPNCACAPGYSSTSSCTCAQIGICNAATNMCNSQALAFIDLVRTDWVYAGMLATTATAVLGQATEITGTVTAAGGGAIDNSPTTRRYMGSILLTAEDVMRGTVNLLMENDPLSTFATDENIIPFPGPNLEGVSINFNACEGVVCNSDQCTTQQCIGGVCQIVSQQPNGTACDRDSNLCTIDECTAGVCVFKQPKLCLPPTTCNPANGQCEGGATCMIMSMDPPNCEIDARQTSDVNSAAPAQGVSAFTLTFNGTCNAGTLLASNFTRRVVPNDVTPPAIQSYSGAGTTGTVTLAGPIPAKHWTCIKHTASNTEKCFGFLPGDVDGNLTSNAADIIALLDSLDGMAVQPIFATDANRSTMPNELDVTRAIDLLNGGGVYTQWSGQTLQACPTP